jgi:flagellar protein FliS
MLFDGAKAAIAMARHQMSVGNLAAKSSSISKAINIVENGLKASLDFEAGGSDGAELASNLSVFYDYIVRQLLLANLRNDQNLLVEVDRLLENIGSAWREVDIRLTAQKASVATLATRISVGV